MIKESNKKRVRRFRRKTKLTALDIQKIKKGKKALLTPVDAVEQDLQINRKKLDWENARQPKLHEKYNRRFIAAYKSFLLAETEFNRARARMARDIRSSPEDYGLERVTDQSMRWAIALHPEYDKHEEPYIDAILAFERAASTLDNVSKRGHLLTNLKSMMSDGWFTPTSMSVGDDEEH